MCNALGSDFKYAVKVTRRFSRSTNLFTGFFIVLPDAIGIGTVISGFKRTCECIDLAFNIIKYFSLGPFRQWFTVHV